MARLTNEDREKILADFHTGQFSKNELAKKYKTSHTTINKLTKGIEPKNKTIVSTQIAHRTALSEQSFKEVSAVETIVDEKTKHLVFFQNSALKNQELANKQISDESELYDLKIHADLTNKNKQSVLGKDADTQVNINNSNTQQSLEQTGIHIKFSDDE